MARQIPLTKWCAKVIVARASAGRRRQRSRRPRSPSATASFRLSRNKATGLVEEPTRESAGQYVRLYGRRDARCCAKQRRAIWRDDERFAWEIPAAATRCHGPDWAGASILHSPGASHRSAGGPRLQHVARSRWFGAVLSLYTGYVAADRDGSRFVGGALQSPTM
jgi:hypothetical protein